MIKTKYYFKSKLVKVRDSEISDVFELAPNMRESDKKEVWKSHHYTAEEALLKGHTHSIICFTIELNEKPIAMFGVVPNNLLDDKAHVWLLATPELDKMKRHFLRESKNFIKLMLENYPLLFNYVDIENFESIRYLKYCGAEFGVIVKYGVEQQMFQYFQFKKRST